MEPRLVSLDMPSDIPFPIRETNNFLFATKSHLQIDYVLGLGVSV